MGLLRKLNKRMGSAVGYEVRRVGRSDAPAGARTTGTAHAADDAAGRARSPQVAFRPPEDPKADRLVRRPVFVVCPVRSGSTLLRLLLGAHSRLYAPHELHVRRLEVRCSARLAERSMGVLGLERGDLEHLLWDRVLHRELVKSGKDFIVEKTPSNAFAYQRLAACWPEARFLFLLRHPASIARSWYEADPEKRTPEEAALDALRYMRATERARRALPGHTVRYEELTADPESALKGICAFLGVDFEPEMLEYGTRAGDELRDLQKGLGDWKEKIRSGRVQRGRELPTGDEIPEPLREISAAWGYLDGRAAEAGAPAEAGASAAHAEIDKVWTRDGRIRITGALHGESAPPDVRWRLLLVPRGDKKRRLIYPATLDGTRFDASFPVSDLARDDVSEPSKPSQWDIHLVTDTDDGEVRLRAGRHLDDLKDKKRTLVFPAQRALLDGGHAVLVKPYYTVKDNLSVECAADEARTPAEAGMTAKARSTS
ncbi:sulfotransferase [Streptomyces sp. HC44]|uniref:Sulfotransferase n=1 Tax=Streptomyces scabichelini TaxID=2711217 RepID=A0A6G4VHW2_9ACTN|nr:sulfotransferase [Streptomyces scabichelini]NGO13742.1 sulfotransferase [Streptomyces scabichelini]